jgi:hypothetical protein
MPGYSVKANIITVFAASLLPTQENQGKKVGVITTPISQA